LRVQGVVQADQKQPLAGAVVTAVQPATASGRPAQQPFYTVTKADGTFSFDGLPEGKYQFCVQVTGGDVLDPCRWSASPPVLEVAAARKAEPFVITVQRGIFVHVRLDDEAGMLRKSQQPVIVGVFVPQGMFHTASVVVDDAQGRTYRVLAAAETPLNLFVRGSGLQLADEKGTALKAEDSAQVFQVSRDEKQKMFRFRLKEVGK